MRNSHFSRVDAGNPLAMPISSSQLMTRGVATARLGSISCVGALLLTLLLMQVREVGDGMRGVGGGGVGRGVHSNDERVCWAGWVHVVSMSATVTELGGEQTGRGYAEWSKVE